MGLGAALMEETQLDERTGRILNAGLVADGTLRPGRLVSTVIGLDDAPAALMAMDHPPAGPGMTVITL